MTQNRWALAGLLLAACVSLVLTFTIRVTAQEDNGGGAQPAAKADPGNAAPPPKPKNYLVWMYEANGLLYTTLFLALSFNAVALFVMNLLSARRDQIVPSELAEGFKLCLDEKRYQDAYDMARQDESVLGQVLAVGLARVSDGYEDMTGAMVEELEEENLKLDHRLSYLALIGTISPMVGLFGTVDGMIRSFSVIAVASQAPKPSELAGGISTALFTTLEGLFIAIPCVAAFNILKNRFAKLITEVGMVAEELVRRFKKVQTQQQPKA